MDRYLKLPAAIQQLVNSDRTGLLLDMQVQHGARHGGTQYQHTAQCKTATTAFPGELEPTARTPQSHVK